MSGVDYFSDDQAINPFMDSGVAIDIDEARREHDAIQAALESAGVSVRRVEPPEGCQDGVFTANWALIRGDKAILARLPDARKAEEVYAKQVLESLGKTVFELPADISKFSGQGDSLPCGRYLFCGSGYRSDEAAQVYAAELLGYQRVQLRARPQIDEDGQPVINKFSGWPDSFYYDLDLAVSILRAPEYDGVDIVKNGLIGYCPDALMPESVELIRSLPGLDLIEVSEHEAVDKLACNLVSTGDRVIMNDAPDYAITIESYGLTTTRLHNPELAKGGGSVRCTTLSLS